MKRLALLFLFLFMGACAGISLKHEPVTIKELLPVGSMLRLTSSVEIPAGHGYVYIANGKPVPFKPYNTVNIYRPYCQLHLHKVTRNIHVVAPDRFRVTKVVEWEDYPAQRQPGGLRYANAGMADLQIHGSVGVGAMDNGGPSTVMYATIIGLQSDSQPEVEELVCGHWDTQGEVEPLTLKQMQSALGDLIQLESQGLPTRE